MEKQDDVSKRIIQDGPSNLRFLKVTLAKLVITVFILLAASVLWMWYDAQACALFFSAESDMNNGKYASAREKGEKAAQHMALALQFNKLVLGESHAEVANDTLNLARCYDMCLEYDKANELHQKACDLFKKSKGPEDWEYAWSLVSFGDHYRYRKDPDKALDYYHRAMPIIERNHGNKGNEYNWTVQRIEMAQKLKGH